MLWHFGKSHQRAPFARLYRLGQHTDVTKAMKLKSEESDAGGASLT